MFLRNCVSVGFVAAPSKSHKIIICKREFISKNIYGWVLLLFFSPASSTRASMEFLLFASLCLCICVCVTGCVCVRIWECANVTSLERVCGNNWRIYCFPPSNINLICKPFSARVLRLIRSIWTGAHLLHFYVNVCKNSVTVDGGKLSLIYI